VLDFRYDGGGLGAGGVATLSADGRVIGEGRVSYTTAYYFSFDETLNIGVDRGTPVTDDYPPVANGFTGQIHWVRVDVGDDDQNHLATPAEQQRRLLAHQ
jgi:arylsulfatase